MWFLLLALGGLLVAANKPKSGAPLIAGASLPWSPPPGAELVASLLGVRRGTSFPVDVYNWKKNGVVYVLAVATNDASSFVAYCSSGGPSRKKCIARGEGILSQRISNAALNNGPRL